MTCKHCKHLYVIAHFLGGDLAGLLSLMPFLTQVTEDSLNLFRIKENTFPWLLLFFILFVTPPMTPTVCSGVQDWQAPISLSSSHLQWEPWRKLSILCLQQCWEKTRGTLGDRRLDFYIFRILKRVATILSLESSTAHLLSQGINCWEHTAGIFLLKSDLKCQAKHMPGDWIRSLIFF